MTIAQAVQRDPVEGLAGLLRLRDGAAARHADRVAHLARAVGLRLQLEAEDVDRIEDAARVQDVAKLVLPDRILHTSRPLTREERNAVHRHADWVAGTLASIPGLDEVAPIVRARHERWDGTGHPFGLIGEAIPVGSRILAVCDGYCSLTRTTAYRDAVPADRATAVLAGAAGAQFDPRVVAALVVTLREDPELCPPEDEEAHAQPRTGRFTRADATPSTDRPAAGGGARLRAAIESTRLPALSETHRRMEQLLGENPLPTATMADLAELDPGMAAALLRAAGPDVGGVAEALETLTPDAVANLLGEMATVDFFARLPGGQSVEQFRAHAVAVRRAARRIARLIDHEAPDVVAAAALFHDVGKLVLCSLTPSYAEFTATNRLSPEAAVREERRGFGMDHGLAGSAILGHWGINRRIVDAVGSHHDTAESHDGTLLCLADLIAHADSSDVIDPHVMTDVARLLGLSSEDLRDVLFELQPAGVRRSERPDPCPLSPKELSLLRGLAASKTYKDIALDHGIVMSTVRSHFSNIYAKLGVLDRAQAVLTAAERGWL